MSEYYFVIPVMLPDTDALTYLSIQHLDETFSTELWGEPISIINNGDNSWSAVTGNVDQLTVNVIGQQIEKFYQRKLS